MIHKFASFDLDTERRELRRSGMLVSVEPQVFALLQFLIENRDRVVSKEEIVARIWNGRIISDAAISSRIKSARAAIGDDGRAQGFIRTLHKSGFRFVADMQVAPTVQSELPESPEPIQRPSIAVIPFERLGTANGHEAICEALPHDLIVALSRLRWLFVIARGSSFRFRADEIEQARKALNVRYCLTGTVEVSNAVLRIGVELSDAKSGVVWSESYRGKADAVHEICDAIVRSVVNALELQIPSNEAAHGVHKPPESLDAWSAYHLGLHHMYHFNREGNARAQALFERAIALEPGFARAQAGLSFTHFENAFLRFAHDQAGAATLAERHAEMAIEHDPLDPFCNLVMGRVSWLRGDLEASLPWLDRAITLNPNYAQAKYSRAWSESLLGHGQKGLADSDAARELSPLDPLLYGMLGVRALSHIELGQPAEAVLWADRAARAPRAHALIEMIAVVAHSLNGDEAKAKRWLQSATQRHPGLDAAIFLRTFPFRNEHTRWEIRAALARLSA
jgi:TolB-like protein/tetratricopeptide (TPR) repeat protein